MTISKRAIKTIIFILIFIILSIVALKLVLKVDNNEMNEEKKIVEVIEDTQKSELYVIRKYENNIYEPNNAIYGFMDKDGQTVIEPKYKFVTPFHEGVACVHDIKDNQYLIDVNDNKVCAIEEFYTGTYDGLWHILKDDKYGCIDKNGDLVIEPKFDYKLEFSEELAVTRINDKWGFIDRKGEWVIEPKFDGLYKFSEGLAAARLNEKWGYIDKNGDWVIEPKFDSAFGFSEDLSDVEFDGKCGYIDKNGDWTIEPKFDKTFSFLDGIAEVEIDGKRGYIDRKGEWVIKPEFDPMVNPMAEFKNGYAQIYENNKAGIINSKGEVIVAPKYDDIYIPAVDNGWFLFRQNSLYGVLSVTGEEALKPIYEMCYRLDKTIILRDGGTIYFLDENLNIKNEYRIGLGLIFEYNQDKDITNLVTEDKQFYFNNDGQLLRECYLDYSDFLVEQN